MKNNVPAPSGAIDPKSSEIIEMVAQNASNPMGASFDASPGFAEMRRLQDATKFNKARFSLRLYRK